MKLQHSRLATDDQFSGLPPPSLRHLSRQLYIHFDLSQFAFSSICLFQRHSLAGRGAGNQFV